jgi:hypothetical protein
MRFCHILSKQRKVVAPPVIESIKGFVCETIEFIQKGDVLSHIYIYIEIRALSCYLHGPVFEPAKFL